MSLNDSTSKRVLDLLEPVKLIVWKVMIERVTVIKFRMDNGGGNGKNEHGTKITTMQQRSTEQHSTVDLRCRLTNFKMLVSHSMSVVLRQSV